MSFSIKKRVNVLLKNNVRPPNDLCFKTDIWTGTQIIPDRTPENATSVATHDKLWKMTQIEGKEKERHLVEVLHNGWHDERQWTGSFQKQQHTITRLAVHGFHLKICDNNYFHQPNDTCMCSICKELCDRYLKWIGAHLHVTRASYPFLQCKMHYIFYIGVGILCWKIYNRQGWWCDK